MEHELKKSMRPGVIATRILVFAASIATISLLAGMIGYVLARGISHISWNFITSGPSALEKTYGILPMLINTGYIIVIGLLVAIPVGIGSAIYLAEFAKQGRLVNLIRSTIEILAGIPSIVYGLFGAALFVTYLDFGYSILSGGLTLAVMVLPTIIRTTEESLMAVDPTYREGGQSMGVSKLYIIRTILIPCAIPGIVTAVILSIGRMVGESAALLYTSSIAMNMPAFYSLGDVFAHCMDSGASLTVQMYLYATEAAAPLDVTFAIASVLMILVFILNMLSTWFASKFRKG